MTKLKSLILKMIDDVLELLYDLFGQKTQRLDVNKNRDEIKAESTLTAPRRKPGEVSASDPRTFDDVMFDLLGNPDSRSTQSKRDISGKPESYIEDYISRVLEREGGFVNHSADRGGATNLGITQETLSNYLGRPASVDDVKNLDEKTAADIYRNMYYKQPKIYQLPEHLREQAFDIAVNSGPTRAVKMIQELAGVKQDGIIGPRTIEAASQVSPGQLTDRRKQFFKQIAQNDPSQQVFLKGWLNRADKFKDS